MYKLMLTVLHTITPKACNMIIPKCPLECTVYIGVLQYKLYHTCTSFPLCEIYTASCSKELCPVKLRGINYNVWLSAPLNENVFCIYSIMDCSYGTSQSSRVLDKQVECTSEPTQGTMIACNNALSGESLPPASTHEAERADSLLVLPPIPEKSPRVRALSASTAAVILPPIPPRTKPVETSPRHTPPTPVLSDKPTAGVITVPADNDTTVCSPRQQVVTEVTTLKGLSERPDDLPAVARVIDGYYGHTSQFSVSAGDCFQVNSLKHTQVLNMQDLAGREYTVPLTSAMKIGLLSEFSNETLNPRAVSSILTMTKLPYVICARIDGEDKKGKVKVGKGDLLIVKERKRKALQCRNLTTGSDILLHKHFEGTFTLDPKLTPLEIVSHLPDVFPCKARLYSAHARANDGKEGSEKIVMLKGCSVNASLVAIELQPTSMEKGNLVSIPLDKNLAKLRVEILATNNEQHLYDDAHDLMQRFDPLHGLTSVEGTDAAVNNRSTYLPKTCPDQNVGEELPMDKKKPPTKENKGKDKCSGPCSEAASNGGGAHDTSNKSALVMSQRGNSNNHPVLPQHYNKNTSATAAATPQIITPNVSVDSGTESDEYTDIADITPSKKSSQPHVKPRKKYRVKSPSVEVHTAEQANSVDTVPPKPLATFASPAPVESASDDHYATIPDIALKIRCQTGPQPIAKPRRQPGTSHTAGACNPVTSRPLPPPRSSSVVPATHKAVPCERSDKPRPPLSPKPKNMSGYVTLQPSCHDSNPPEQYSIITPTLSSFTQPPSVATPHEPLLAAHQLQAQKKNKEFLMSMKTSQVSIC